MALALLVITFRDILRLGPVSKAEVHSLSTRGLLGPVCRPCVLSLSGALP